MWFEELAKKKQLSYEIGTYAGICGKAIFNSDRTRRYFLEKRWREEGGTLTAVMMNPSNAAHDQTDETVDQLINVAKDRNCNALYVVNVASGIGGTSTKLKSDHFIYEDINWAFISRAVKEADTVFLGWGMKGQLGTLSHKTTDASIVTTYKSVSSKLYCYDVLKSLDKKYSKVPLYYVPHPRPIFGKEKYRNVPIRMITEHEFVHLFSR